MPNTYQDQYDVVVIGGGMAGLTAAVAAAKQKCKTILVERHPYCGGAFTAGMVDHIAGLIDHRHFSRLDSHSPSDQPSNVMNPKEWIVQGLACEYHDRLDQYGAAIGPHWDHDVAKIIFDEMLQEYGVMVLYGAQFHSADVQDKKIHSVDVIFRTSKITLMGDVFIDATGDGDLGVEAGVEFHFGRESDGKMMPATLSCMVADTKTPEGIYPKELLIQACEKGDLPRTIHPFSGLPRYVEGKQRTELWCSPVRQWGNSTDPWDYSRMEAGGRAVLWQYLRYLREHLATWKDAYLSSIGHQIWPREGRHFKTQYTLTADDVRSRARFTDVIARGAFYLDLHAVTPNDMGFDLNEHDDTWDTWFDIPYSSLVPLGVENLLLAGRTIGAAHQGHSAIRVMGTSIATGQAAGQAAALMLKEQTANNRLNAKTLQNALRSEGVVI